MTQLRIEAEYGYGGEVNFQIIEPDEEYGDEIVAVVYGRQDIAEALVNAVQAFKVLEKM